MSNGPPSQRDRRSLQDLAKLASSPTLAPLSSREVGGVPSSRIPVSSKTPAPPPASGRSPEHDSGIVDLKQIASSDPAAEERAKSTQLASAPLFDDDEAPSVAPPPLSQPSSRPVPSSAPASAPKSSKAPASSTLASVAPAPAAQKSSVLMPVVGGLVLAAVAAGILVMVRPRHEPPLPPPPVPVAAAPQLPAVPPAAATSAAVAPAPSPPAATAQGAPEPETQAPSDSRTTSAKGAGQGGGRHAAQAIKKEAPESPGGSTVSGLSAMMAQATNGTTTQSAAAAPAPAGALGDAVQRAVGATAGVPAPAAAPAEGEPSFAPGSVPQKPSQGAVTGALGRALPAARSCLNPDDPVSRANVTFSSPGTVSAVVVTGSAAGKPAEQCIKDALLKATVPPFALPTYSANVTIRPN